MPCVAEAHLSTREANSGFGSQACSSATALAHDVYGAAPLIVLELLEGGPLFRRLLFDRDRPAVREGSKPLPDIGLDLIRMIVFETGLAHLGGIFPQSRFHARVLVDEVILWVVVGCLQLFRLEHLLDGLARATTSPGEVLCLKPNRECRVGILTEERAVVGNLISRRKVLVALHIPFTQAYLSWTVTLGKLRGSTGIQRRNAEPILGDELFLAESRQIFVGGHPLAHRVVVSGDVLEPLVTHALGDQRFNLLDGLDELRACEAELLCTHTRRSLGAGAAGKEEHDHDSHDSLNHVSHGMTSPSSIARVFWPELLRVDFMVSTAFFVQSYCSILFCSLEVSRAGLAPNRK